MSSQPRGDRGGSLDLVELLKGLEAETCIHRC